MSVVSNPLIGHSSGKIGNVVFSTWKGLDVLKNKPMSVANPNTDSQQMRRSALSQVVSIFRQAPGAIRAGYNKLAVQMSEWNAFAREVLNNSFNYATPPTATLVPANLLISKGTISSTPILTNVSDVSDGTIAVTFATTATDPGQSAGDKAIVVGFNSTTGDWTGGTTAMLRSSGAANIPLPAGWVAGNVTRIYLAFFNSLSGESSDSINATGTVIA